MPTYEYRREDGTTFEITQRISEDPLTHDPETGQPVQRLISGGSGLIFKGTGFYQTDYKPSGAPANGKGSSDKAETSSATNESSASTASTSSASTSDD